MTLLVYILAVALGSVLVPTIAYGFMYAASLGWHRAKYRSYHQQIVDKA